MNNIGFQRAYDGRDPIQGAASELVTVEQWGDTTFIHLPLFFPSGAAATVCVSRSEGGFLVSDHGFAYRELEAIGAERSFARTAGTIAGRAEIAKDRRRLFVEAKQDDLARAICDVGAASWQVVDKIYTDRREDEDEIELEDELTAKLVSLFGEPNVKVREKLFGSSSTEWGVSAVVENAKSKTVFQAVSNHPASVYRANSAFHDLARTQKPPKLIAVVRNLEALGSRLAVLSQAGKVIAEASSEDIFRRLAR
jgi:hypothetical protein